MNLPRRLPSEARGSQVDKRANVAVFNLALFLPISGWTGLNPLLDHPSYRIETTDWLYIDSPCTIKIIKSLFIAVVYKIVL